MITSAMLTEAAPIPRPSRQSSIGAGAGVDEELVAEQELTSSVDKTKANQKESIAPDLKPARAKQIELETKVMAERRDLLAEKFPRSLAVQNAAAAQAVQAGDYRRGLAYADSAVALAEARKDRAGLASALYTRAVGAMWGGQFPKAAEDAARILRMNPKDVNARTIYQMAKGRSEGQAAASATQRPLPDAFSASVLDDPRVRAAGRRAADRRQAIRQLEEARRLNAVSDARGALAAAESALAADPGVAADASMQKAMAWAALKDLAKALDELSRAIALWTAQGKTPNLASAYGIRASLRRAAGAHDGALEDAERALVYDPASGAAFAERARARQALGQKGEQVLADFKRAAELDPDFKAEYQAAFARFSKPDPAPATAAGGRRPARFVWALGAALLLVGGALAFARRRPAASADAGGRRAIDAQYEIVEPLGEGGMGSVYKGWDKSLKRSVAIKRLRAELQQNARERERFIKEAELVASLRHPHIVEIYTIVRDRDDTYLVFEHIVGKTVHQMMDQQPGRRLPPKAALKILKSVAEAVDHAHSRLVIHRDLKPANVMVGENGWVKVMDFGIARQVQDSLLTMTATIVGTPSYMPPEQSLGAMVMQSDVYSLGVTFYEMLTGDLPFLPNAEMDKLEGRFKPASRAAPELPAAIDAVLSKAMASKTDERYRSCGEFYEAAARALDGRAASVS